MNQVDFFILVILGIATANGVRRGLLLGAADLAGLLVAVAAGSFLYRLGGAFFGLFLASPALAGFLGFVLIALLAAGLTGWAMLKWLGEREFPRRLDHFGGGACGLSLGALLAGMGVMASGLVPGAAAPVKHSALAPAFMSLVPGALEGLEHLGIAVPKLVRLPVSYEEELKGTRQGLQFLQINFSRLDGSHCINCGHRVRFLGYKFSRGTLLSPKFRCPNCGRTSDGCQLFEGFHRIYGQCPVELAERGILFDCGVWTNGWWVVPRGRCPVDGREYRGPGPPKPDQETADEAERWS
jgi:uncharacterized membrane protein required for colicin V production